MKKKNKIKPYSRKTTENNKNILPGYPLYPAGEDIYNRYKEETEIDPEEISKKK